MNVQAAIEQLRSEYGDRPPGEALLEVLDRCDTDEERAAIEQAFIRESDNSTRPEDRPES